MADDGAREDVDFDQILAGAVVAISGLENPERGEVREKAAAMGAQYRPDWSPDCTLLLAVYANAPKVRKVSDANGTIVHKDWIHECYRQRRLCPMGDSLMHRGLPWKRPPASSAQGGARGRGQARGRGRDLGSRGRAGQGRGEPPAEAPRDPSRDRPRDTPRNTPRDTATDSDRAAPRSHIMRDWHANHGAGTLGTAPDLGGAQAGAGGMAQAAAGRGGVPGVGQGDEGQSRDGKRRRLLVPSLEDEEEGPGLGQGPGDGTGPAPGAGTGHEAPGVLGPEEKHGGKEEPEEETVEADMRCNLKFLQRQKEKPPENEMVTVAGEGLLACFDDALAAALQAQGERRDIVKATEQEASEWPVMPHPLRAFLREHKGPPLPTPGVLTAALVSLQRAKGEYETQLRSAEEAIETMGFRNFLSSQLPGSRGGPRALPGGQASLPGSPGKAAGSQQQEQQQQQPPQQRAAVKAEQDHGDGGAQGEVGRSSSTLQGQVMRPCTAAGAGDGLQAEEQSGGVKEVPLSAEVDPARVRADVEQNIAFLRAQEEKPPESEISHVAVEGLLTCFEDALEAASTAQDARAAFQAAKEILNDWPVVPYPLRKVAEAGALRKEDLQVLEDLVKSYGSAARSHVTRKTPPEIEGRESAETEDLTTCQGDLHDVSSYNQT